MEGVSETAHGELKFDVTTPHFIWKGLTPGLPGQHQGENLATALMALEILEKLELKVEPAQVATAVAHTCWPGRLEWLGPATVLPGSILLDGAHNHAGLLALRSYLNQCDLKAVHWVCGFKEDKDASKMVPELRNYVTRFYAVPAPVESHWDPNDLAAIATSTGLKAQAYAGVETALTQAMENCKSHEIVLVAGSLFLVAEVRRILNRFI